LTIRPLTAAVVFGVISSATAFATGVAVAQAPHITTAGDPSVNPDTIYALAVKPADYPEQTEAILLDDGVVRLEPDGRGSNTYRQIIQILRPEAVDQYAEQQFSYAPRHQRFTLNWIHVVKPDGTVISSAPSHVQESDVPAQFGDPTYSDQKVVRVSLSGVAAGTIVDYSYTIEELKPYLSGDFFEPWSVNSGPPVVRSRYMVDVPAGFTPRIHETNLNFKRTERTVGGRHVYMWATRDIPLVKGQLFAADSNGVFMSVRISSPTTWAQIGKWYADNARSRYVATPAVDSAIHAAVKDARTLDDSIRAVHRWVAQDIRYVAIALGMGGYQPRAPDEVVRTGFGDCKDKATLFVVAMKKIGVTAYPVLLSSTGGVDRDMPSISQLDHAIAAFKRHGESKYEYVDLTASLTPLGEIPHDYQGEFGMVVHPDGAVEEITFPMAPVTANRSDRRIVGTLSTDGEFNGHYFADGVGASQYSLRSAFENPLDSTQRANAANAIARGVFDGAQGDSLIGFAGKDLRATPRLSIVVKNGHAASMAGNNAILTNPFGSMSAFTTLATQLEAEGKRVFPIDATKVFGYGQASMELRLTLPDGWHAELPPGVTAASEFGKYESAYRQDGRDLILTRTMTGVPGVYPPDRIGALLDWVRSIAKDDAKLIVIEKAAK
jgi:transglutaminase-like putative cysteine protease